MTDWFVRPVLHVTDVEASLRFYVNRLGFTSPWRYTQGAQGWRKAAADGHEQAQNCGEQKWLAWVELPRTRVPCRGGRRLPEAWCSAAKRFAVMSRGCAPRATCTAISDERLDTVKLRRP